MLFLRRLGLLHTGFYKIKQLLRIIEVCFILYIDGFC